MFLLTYEVACCTLWCILFDAYYFIRMNYCLCRLLLMLIMVIYGKILSVVKLIQNNQQEKNSSCVVLCEDSGETRKLKPWPSWGKRDMKWVDGPTRSWRYCELSSSKFWVVVIWIDGSLKCNWRVPRLCSEAKHMFLKSTTIFVGKDKNEVHNVSLAFTKSRHV